MDKPLISILMPFKDTAGYLRECIDSIRQQSYPHWELLAVDDHSRDLGPSLLGNFTREDARIKLLKNKGEGIIRALRTAYGASTGSVITRMDSDDIMVADKLKIMLDALHMAGRGNISLGKVKYFSSTGISNGYKRYETWLNRLTHLGSNFEERYKECVIPSPCWMVFREDLDKCGAFQGDRYPEDYDLAFRMYASGMKCLPCDTVLHLWRDYPTRTSRTSPNYANNTFLEMKVHYFLSLDRDWKRPLIVWGAGTKGKKVASLLLKNDRLFTWVCDNPKKIGKKVYGKELISYRNIPGKIPKPQSIVTVANVKAQREIREFLDREGFVEMTHYFFFC
jgi:glycosyltransferase involved in cell wall biosynthesis